MFFFIFQINFFEKFFRNTIRVSNSLDQDQAQFFAGLIWVQTVCKGYQQAILVGKEFIISKTLTVYQTFYKVLKFNLTVR